MAEDREALISRTARAAAHRPPVAMLSIPSILVALSLLALAGWLTQSHLRALGAAERAGGSENDHRFARRQCRRRVQASAMIGLLGVCIFIGQFILDPVLWFFFWCGVLVLIIWLLVLAMADLLDSHQFFARIRRENLAEQVKLQHELRRQALEDGSSAEE